MSTVAVDIALAGGFALGEGPRWDPQTQRVWWVDILGQRIWSGRLAGTRITDTRSIATTDTVGYVAFVEGAAGDERLVAGVGLTFTPVVAGVAGAPVVVDHDRGGPARFNDGVVDAAGHVVAGVMGMNAEHGWGALYRLGPDGVSTLIETMTIPNGPVFSPDGRRMYLADTAEHRIDVFPYDPASGRLGAPERFVDVGDESPDGLCVDAAGGVWVALWGSAQVRRYNPDGGLSETVDVPARQPTACCFCGPELDTMVITSATVGLDDPGPADGSLMVVRPGYRGLPSWRVAPEVWPG